MKILDFYGQKLRIEDISSVVIRKAKLSSAVDSIGNIIGFLFFIIVIIILYMMYKSHQLTDSDAVGYGVMTTIAIIVIGTIREKFFNEIYMVEIKMRSGDNHKSHKMNIDEATEKQMVILDEIE